jgi:arylsulfatase A-like enzyme
LSIAVVMGETMVHLSFLIAAALIALSPMAHAAERPNIVLILADDLGYSEVGALHQPDTATPNIDAIAQAGVVATSGYVSAPVCAPSRAGILTGRYQQSFGIYHNPPPGSDPRRASGGLPPDVATIAERLRALGYATGMAGKWHVGYRPDQHPMRRGFDEFFGAIDSSPPYQGERPGNPVLRGFTPEPQSDYLTDVFAREAVSFIGRHANEPFFLYLPFTAIHAPLQARPDKLERFAQIRDKTRRTIAAMLSSLDDAVGSVTAALREQGLAGNTIVAFLGDNGCIRCKRPPLRAGKGALYEGGIRVPFIVSWPGVLPAGSRADAPVSSLDLAATLLEAAGGSAAGLDGASLVTALNGGPAPHACLFWGGQVLGAVRCGDWKLIDIRGLEPQLFDLRADLREAHDVAAAHPAVVADLLQARAEWLQKLAPATWPSVGRWSPWPGLVAEFRLDADSPRMSFAAPGQASADWP